MRLLYTGTGGRSTVPPLTAEEPVNGATVDRGEWRSIPFEAAVGAYAAGARPSHKTVVGLLGAGGRNRTVDLLFTSPGSAIISRPGGLSRIPHNPCTASTFCPQPLSHVSVLGEAVVAGPVDKTVDT